MLDESTIASLKAKHGDTLVAVESRDGTILVFRKPSRQEFDRWFDKREEKGSAAARELAQATVVYPDGAALTAALDKQPALLMCKDGIVDSVAELAGLGGGAATSKKL